MTACPACAFDPDATISARWEFHIGREVKSGNDRVNNVGGSRWRYRQVRDEWFCDVANIAGINAVTRASSLRRVTLTRCYGKGQRAFDRDNLATGCKPIVDAMVRSGLLVDDNPRHAEIHYKQIKNNGRVGLLVVIEEIA